MKRFFTFAITLLVAVVFAPTSASAQDLYGIDVAGNLFTIDVTTGAGTPVGVLPNGPFANPVLPGYNEVEIDEISGRAWAQQRDGNFHAQEFDLATGAGIGAPVFNAASWHGMEFIGGTLYAAGFPDPGIPGFLATLDPTTGVSNFIGPTGLPAGQITGLAYHPGSGVLYGISGGVRFGISSLYTIDMTTGVATLVGPAGMTAGSLSFGPDGNLYAGGVAGNQGDLYRIDTATGAGTFVGATGFGTGAGNGLSGLSLGPVPPQPIPAVSSTGMIVMSLLLAGVAVFVINRNLF